MSRKTFQRVIAISVVAALSLCVFFLYRTLAISKERRAADSFIQLIEVADSSTSYQKTSQLFKQFISLESWNETVSKETVRLTGKRTYVGQQKIDQNKTKVLYEVDFKGYLLQLRVDLTENDGELLVDYYDSYLSTNEQEGINEEN